MTMDSLPDPWLDLALDLAAQAIGGSDPNPRVGCVVVDAQQRMLGKGCTQPIGQAHAEVMALRDAAASGLDIKGATVFVTLEPCSHHGRTPPCCDALVQAGVSRVVVALQDPNPLVAGRGLARLRAAGIEVLLLPAEHPVAQASQELNIGFFSRMLRGRPWVRMKIASSLDGTTALENGQSQWITGEAARADGHQWRKRASAVLTGIGTVLEDDPLLDVRLVPTQRQPALVLVDSRLEVPLDARLFSVAARPVLVYTAAIEAKAKALEAKGARVFQMPGPWSSGQSKVDLAAMLRDLALQHHVNELHVEAGYKLNGSLWREGLVDELLVYLAPKLLGAGRPMANFGPLSQLTEAKPFEFTSFTQIGSDLRILARAPIPAFSQRGQE